MDVFLGNENYFQDKLAATNECHSPEVVDNEEKPMSLDIEHFLTTVGDVNEISRIGTELNLPVPIVSCLDTLIENVGELHKFDSINNLTISSNLIEDLSILSSKSVSEQSLSNCAFSDLENCNTNENSLQKMEKSCPIPEDGEVTPFEVNVSRSGNSNSAILFETDHTPSNNDLGQKVEETVIDGQFNESEDCGIQLSADKQSDQSNMYEIKQSKDLDLMSSKDSVNPIEMDKNLLESNSNEISFMGLNNTVVNFELEEEKVIESDKNENKVKGNSNKRYMEKNCAKSEDKCESEILKGIENNVNLKQKEADVIKYSTDKCVSVADELHSSSDMNCCQVVLNRLKPHILKKYLHFSNLNPIQMQLDANSAILFQTDHTPSNDDLGQKVEETVIDRQFNESEDCGIQLSADKQSDQSKISEIKQSKDLDLMPSKDSVNPIEMDKNLLESNSNENKVKGNSNKRYMEKNCAKSEDKCESEILKRIENNVNLKEKEADVIKYSTDKCVSVADKLHSSSDMNCCQVVLNRLKPNILKKNLHFSNLNPIQMQSDVEKDINLNIDSEENLQRKLNRNLLTKNVNRGKKLNNKNPPKVSIMEKQSLKSKKTGKQLSIEKNYKYADNEEKMFNRFSNLIKCSKLKKAVRGILVRNTLLNESFENEQKNKTMNSDKKKIKELDEKLLNQQKECEKRNSSERKLTVEGDSSWHSKSDGLFKSQLLNLIDGDSLVSKITYNDFNKTQNSSFMTKPCKVLLERLSSEIIKMYSLDVSLFSTSKSANVSFSNKGTNLLDSFLSSSSDEQEDEEMIFRKIQNKSSFKRLKETSHKKLSSNLRNDGVDLKSQKMVSSKINRIKKIVTELNKNISSHVLVFDMIKKQRGTQKKEFKVTSEGDSLYFQNLKYVKSSKKSNEITVVKNKCMHKSSSNMKLIINNNLNDPWKKSQEVKYNKKEIDLKAPYSIKECRIALEKLDSHCLESYLYNSKLNQVPEVCLSYQDNINTDINACMVNQIVHIDRDRNQIVKSPKHLLKKHAKNKTREECVQSTKQKENILKENFLCDVKRKIGSTLLKKDSSKPDNIIYLYGKSVAAEGPVCSGDSRDNLHLNSVPQVNAMDKNWMELDETNRLIKEQIQMKNCSVMLKQCDSAILEKYLGTDWSKKLSKGVHRKSFKADLIDFEDSLVSNSTHSVFPKSEYGDISESNHQMDLSSDSDDSHSVEQVSEFHDKKIPKDLFCKSCTRNFKTYSSLLSHEKKTHKTYCFKCVLCKYVSKNRDSYINHMKRNHPEVEPYVCNFPKCEKSFQNKKKLSDHQKSHQRYCCRFCKKRYAKKTLLLRHVSACH